MRQAKFVLAVIFSAAFIVTAQSAPAVEFEAVSIKPAAPPTEGGIRVEMADTPGRVDWRNVNLRLLLQRAYGLKDYQIANAPDWAATERYNIIGKLPEGATRSQVPDMLKAMLADRFKLTVHKETKELPVYALVVGKNGNKMKPADGEQQSMRQGLGHLDAAGIGMAGLCDFLARQLSRAVIDQTELKGTYEFALDWTPDDGQFQANRAAGTGAPAQGIPVAKEGAPSLVTAVQEQLGLKLEARKAPVESLVIDHTERPSGN